MTQKKIRVNTTLELDDVEYNITIAPLTKKASKKIEKFFKKEKDGSQEYIDLESKLAQLNGDLEITEELLEVEEDNTEKKKLILDKRKTIKEIRDVESKMKPMQEAVVHGITEATEKMSEQIFDEMVSGEDAAKLKEYVSEYSFEVAIKKINEVYEKEIKGK